MSEIEETNPEARYNDDIDITHFIRLAWRGKWLVLALVMLGGVIAIAVALSLPNIYRAEASLAPNQDDPSGLGEYGALASLAGINIGNDAGDKTALGLEILKSRRFISQFIERHDILVPIMAAKGWDLSTSMLILDPKIYNESSGEWVRKPEPPKGQVPSLQEAAEEFKRILTVRQDAKTTIVTVAIDFYDPNLAKQWVEWLVRDINHTVMEQDVTKAEQAIQYLNKQIQATSVADLQKVFSD